MVAELEAFAATHTLDELRAEINRRIDAETSINLNSPQSASKALPILSPEDEQSISECIARRRRSCRLTFEADVLTAAAGTVVAAGACTAITALTGVIICSAAALVGQQLLNGAAYRRQQACELNGIQDCYERTGDGGGLT